MSAEPVIGVAQPLPGARPRPPAQVGTSIARSDRYSREDIEVFAAACHDLNPLHTDDARAQRSRFGEVIASAQQTSSMLLGLATSHFAQTNEVLVLHVNHAFRAPIFASEEVRLHWSVSELTWNDKLGGYVVLLNGDASTARAKPALVSRVSLLVKALA